MNPKRIYLAATALMSLMMVVSAVMYLMNTEQIRAEFERLGFPAYLVIPLAIAKLLGVAAIWAQRGTRLAEWAYAGFCFDFLLALSGHVAAGDSDWAGALVALVLLLISYTFGHKSNFGRDGSS